MNIRLELYEIFMYGGLESFDKVIYSHSILTNISSNSKCFQLKVSNTWRERKERMAVCRQERDSVWTVVGSHT